MSAAATQGRSLGGAATGAAAKPCLPQLPRGLHLLLNSSRREPGGALALGGLAGRAHRRPGLQWRSRGALLLRRDAPFGTSGLQGVLPQTPGGDAGCRAVPGLGSASPAPLGSASPLPAPFAGGEVYQPAVPVTLGGAPLVAPLVDLLPASPVLPSNEPRAVTESAGEALGPRTAFVSSATLAPVITPAGLVPQPGSDGALKSFDEEALRPTDRVYVVAQSESEPAPLSAASAVAAAAASIGVAPPAQAILTDAPAAEPEQPPQQQPSLWDRVRAKVAGVQWYKVWCLALLAVSYVHQATTGFALPAMLPMISNELHLTDMQGALLTTGYSYLYAVALVPIGLLADRVSRPKLLAAGLAVWSILTCTASTCRSFSELILARVGFAAAQGAQNPVCFSLIPELFPVNKSTALSLYNCAIYVGRALSFAAVLAARHLHDNDQAHLAARGGVRVETRLDHLDRADLHSLSITHTTGDMAAATPDREFNFPLWEYGSDLPDSAWRQVLRWIALPGFLIAIAMMLTVQEPRQQPGATAAAAAATAPAAAVTASKPAAAGSTVPLATAPSLAASAPDSKPAEALQTESKPESGSGSGTPSASSSRAGIMALLSSPGFMSVTLAAALNDVGSYALIAWQSTFYERVYGLSSAAYAPVLAALLPIGGILGGVGGGFLADRLSRSGQRWLVTAGATCLAAPCLAASCLAPTPELSYAALMVGFGLSEMWRAPSAVMARGIAPASMGSSASALYLCVRNLVGGLGPLLVAGLIGVCGLQAAMLVVPAMYLGSGVLFALAEKLWEKEMREKDAAALAAA